MRNLTRTTALAGLMLVAVSHAPASATTRVDLSYRGCTEVTAVVPAAGLQTAIAVVSFACRSAALGGRELGPTAVSEIVAVHDDGSFVLLRTATDDPSLTHALARAGLPAVVADIQVATGPTLPAGAESVTVTGRGWSYGVTAGAARATTGGRSELNGDGLTHHYDGRRGRITTTYRNTLSGPEGAAGGGAGVVDGARDRELAGWLGAATGAGSVLAISGSWTATVERQARS
jgi:hypothetical protein